MEPDYRILSGYPDFSANSTARNIGVKVTNSLIRIMERVHLNYINVTWILQMIRQCRNLYLYSCIYFCCADQIGTYAICSWFLEWCNMDSKFKFWCKSKSYSCFSLNQAIRTLGGSDFTGRDNTTGYTWYLPLVCWLVGSTNWSPTRTTPLPADI